jgi:hypothetical protein
LNASLELALFSPIYLFYFSLCFFVGHLMEFGRYAQDKPIHSETQLVMAMAGGSDV